MDLRMMMARACVLSTVLAALLGSSVLASADQLLPQRRILDSGVNSGDILFGSLKIGRHQSGKTTLTPDVLQIQGPGSTGPIDGMSVTGTGGALRSMADRVNDVARPEDYVQVTDPDNTLSIQRAASTGRVVALRDGKVYMVCKSIVGTKFTGYGATMRACPKFPPPRYTPPVENNDASFLSNPAWVNDPYTGQRDSKLSVYGITFDATPITTFPTGGFHAIGFRNADGIIVRDVMCLGAGDCAAFRNSSQTYIGNSQSLLTTNAGFDHFEFPKNAVVENSYTECFNTPLKSGAGVQFTAASALGGLSPSDPNYRTDPAGSSGTNLTSRGNIVKHCDVGIAFNILNSVSSLDNIASENDTVDLALDGPQGAGRSLPLGIQVTGNITSGRVSRLRVSNCTGGNPIALTPDGVSGVPSLVLVVDPVVTNCNVGPGGVGVFNIQGPLNVLRGAILKGGTYNYAAYTTDPTTEISGTMDPGVLGLVAATGGPAPGTIRIPSLVRTCTNNGSNSRQCSATMTGNTVSGTAAVQLTTNGGAPSASNVPQFSKSVTASVTVRLTAIQGATGGRAVYEAKGVLMARDVATFETYLLSPSQVFTLVNSAGGGEPSGWPIPTIAADTTYGGIKILSPAVTGLSATAKITFGEMQ